MCGKNGFDDVKFILDINNFYKLLGFVWYLWEVVNVGCVFEGVFGISEFVDGFEEFFYFDSFIFCLFSWVRVSI